MQCITDKVLGFLKKTHATSDDYKLQQMDWNERFQQSLFKIREFNQSTPLQDRIQGNLNLLHLSRDFIFTAQMYGKVIISESQLPPGFFFFASQLGLKFQRRKLSNQLRLLVCWEEKNLLRVASCSNLLWITKDYLV